MLREGADDVVGLVAGGGDGSHAERVYQVAEQRDLRTEGVVAGRAMRLVLLVDLVAEGRTGEVERDRGVVGRLLLEELHHHLQEAQQRAGRPPVAGHQRRQRVESAVEERVSVNKQ